MYMEYTFKKCKQWHAIVLAHPVIKNLSVKHHCLWNSHCCVINAEIKPFNQLQRIALQSYYSFIKLALCPLISPFIECKRDATLEKGCWYPLHGPKVRQRKRPFQSSVSLTSSLKSFGWEQFSFKKTQSAHSGRTQCSSDSDIMCSSPTCSLSSCSLWQRRLFQI